MAWFGGHKTGRSIARRRAPLTLRLLPLESRITPASDKPRLLSPVLSVDPTAYSATEIVAEIKSSQPIQDLANVSAYLGLGSSIDLARSAVIFSDAGQALVSIRLQPGANPIGTAAALSPLTSLFRWVKPNYVYSPSVVSQPGWLERIPNDPAYPQQWHLPAVNAPNAWETTYGSPSVIVGVIDGGIDINHPDLVSNIYRNPGEIPNDGIDNDGNGFTDDLAGWDFSNNTNNTNPDNPLTDTHGTQVAGVLAARVDNGLGGTGLAGNVRILPLKVVGNGALTSISLARAAAYAVQQGAKIVTCSINIDPLVGDPSFEATARFVDNRGVLWVNSAGNASASDPPRQAFEEFIIVAATNRQNLKASYSNYGSGIDLSAPGGEFGDGLRTTTTVLAGSYTTAIGTSLAAPLVAGTAALIWSANSALTRDQVVSRMATTAVDLNPFNSLFLDKLGSGLVNAGQAVNSTGVTRLGNLTGLPAPGTPAIGPLGTLTLHLKAPLAPATVVASNFELRGAGSDNQFFTTDDFLIPLAIANASPIRIGTNDLFFSPQLPLNDGLYRFTAKASGLKDPFGLAIDGDSNGQAGGDYIREFGRSISFTGTLYDDVDGSGDFSPGEPPVDDREIFIDNNGNGVHDVQTGSSSAVMPIADNAGQTTRSTITISGLNGPVRDVRVSVSLRHAQPGDLRIALVAPSGTRITLLGNRFFQSYTANDTWTFTFDDAAGLQPLNGTTLRPDDPLATLFGELGNGPWTLEITDTVPGDAGQLLGWNLAVSDEFSATTDSLGQFAFPGTLPPGSYLVRPEIKPGEWLPRTETIIVDALTANREVDLSIRKIGAVTGRITEPGGAPIAGAVVFGDGNNNGRIDPTERWAISDEGGFYSLTGLSPGTQTLRVALPLGYDVQSPAAGAITITLTNSTAGLTQQNFIATRRLGPALPSIVGVSPDVRRTAVDDVEINFDRPLSGLTKADFRLFRGQTQIPLDGATLIGEGGEYRLTGLAGLTATEGEYRLTVTTPQGGTVPPSSTAFWRVDLTPPSVQSLRPVQNGPGRPPVSANVVFSEAIVGMTLANVRLSRNGTNVPLTNATLGVSNTVFTIGNLAPLTETPGSYVLSIVPDPPILDLAGNTLSGTTSATFTVTDRDQPPGFQDRIVTATAAGRPTQLIVSNSSGTSLFTLMPFGGSFTGGARVTTADVNGDAVADIVVASGAGRIPEVRVFDGKSGQSLSAFLAFEATFTGGVNVAAADFDGDGSPELIVSPDHGGGPRVRVISPNGQTVFADFFGIDDPSFRGGARATAGDMNGDGTPDLIVAAGFGGGPRVAGYDGSTLSLTVRPTKLFNDFFAFEPTLRNGVYLAASDIDGDGYAEFVAAGGPGGGPRVLALSGFDLTTSKTIRPVANFFGGNPANRQGANLAAKDLDGDGRMDLLVVDGPTVRGYLTSAMAADPANPALERQFNPFGLSGGVFVG